MERRRKRGGKGMEWRGKGEWGEELSSNARSKTPLWQIVLFIIMPPPLIGGALSGDAV